MGRSRRASGHIERARGRAVWVVPLVKLVARTIRIVGIDARYTFERSDRSKIRVASTQGVHTVLCMRQYSAVAVVKFFVATLHLVSVHAHLRSHVSNTHGRSKLFMYGADLFAGNASLAVCLVTSNIGDEDGGALEDAEASHLVAVEEPAPLVETVPARPVAVGPEQIEDVARVKRYPPSYLDSFAHYAGAQIHPI